MASRGASLAAARKNDGIVKMNENKTGNYLKCPDHTLLN